MLMDMFYSFIDGMIRYWQRFYFYEVMLKINEQMYKYWKENGEEKFFQYSVLSWIMNLFVDERVKEWLVGEEFYKQQFQMKYIFLVVVDKFFVDQQLIKKGVSIFCFDEIQVFVIIKVSSIWVYLIVFVIWDYFVYFFVYRQLMCLLLWRYLEL